MTPQDWYKINESEAIISPALLVYPDRILHNIRTMIEMAGGANRLRPHIKTHKTAEIIEMQLGQGIRKFKCATIAEAELLVRCGVHDILLAMQPVGADMVRFFNLMDAYPDAAFSTLVDNETTLRTLSELASSREAIVSLWMDINSGMDRTGIVPDEKAVALYLKMDADARVKTMGLHVYDGHLRHSDAEERRKACDSAFGKIESLRSQLEASGAKVPGIVAGGSPTFPFHARREGVEASPGTTLLWDAGYGGLFPEMEFLPAAVLLTRVISKPLENIICLDLGHKHLASEMPFPRVQFLNLENVHQRSQSEEHFVLEHIDERLKGDTQASKVAVVNWPVIGDEIYAVPMHICPTVAKYDSLLVVSEGKVIDAWRVAARDRRITV